MAKKHKWTKAQRAAASKRMKERYRKKREQESAANEAPPLKLGGLMHRLTVLQDDAQELADDIGGIKEALENL